MFLIWKLIVYGVKSSFWVNARESLTQLSCTHVAWEHYSGAPTLDCWEGFDMGTLSP